HLRRWDRRRKRRRRGTVALNRRAGALLLLVFLFSDGSAGSAQLDTLYEEGRTAIARGDFDRARAIAGRGRAASGRNAEARELFTLLAAEALERRDCAGALALIDRTPKSGTANALVRRLMARGHALAAAGRDADAEADFARAAGLAAQRVPELAPEVALL